MCGWCLHIFALHPGNVSDAHGVVSSVHAFARSSIGAWFVSFIVLIILVCLGAYLKNRDYLKSENQLDSIVSRESSFLFNNLILLVSCIAYFRAHCFPFFPSGSLATASAWAGHFLIR